MSVRSWSSALVTGASRGLGRALALELASGGVRELVLIARSGDALEEVARGCEQRGARTIVRALDVGATDELVATVRALDAELGGLDLVIANAGVGAPGDVAPYAWEAIQGPLHVNLCGAAATLTAALPAMVERGRGHLVAIGSLAAYGALPGSAAYCAPKAGLAMLMDCLRLDLATTGVATTHVRLGFVRTEMVARSTHPMPQLMEPSEAASAIARALSRRPREIVLPRGLAAVARLLSALPEPLREAANRALRPSAG